MAAGATVGAKRIGDLYPNELVNSQGDRSKVRSKNTDICARVTGWYGQKIPAPQPDVIFSEASLSIHAAAQYETGTSENMPLGGGGT